MRSRLSRHLRRLTLSLVLLGTAGALAGTTGVLAGTTGLPLGLSSACGCAIEPLPNETTVSGFGQTTKEYKEVPVINWVIKTPITTAGCIGGEVTTKTEAENVETKEKEYRESTLTESPENSGKFTGYLPVMSPLHGEGKVKITVSGCTEPDEDVVVIFVIYIDPSGEVVDGNHSNEPVAEATVTLLASESGTESGPFAAVENGSEVMSPMNRTNPDETREDGSFGWEVIEGYYEVEATKTGCGTATTPAFHVPPPEENLVIVLHCE